MPSLFLILTMYDVINEPPLSGVTQLTTTLRSLIIVLGAIGWAGISAAKIEILYVKAP
jgi:hypothetical protein